MSDEVQMTVISQTQDTGDPVVRLTLGDSNADVIIDTQNECLNVWTVESSEKGDMKSMMDYIVDKTGFTWVQFIAPMGKKDKEIANNMIEEIGVSEDKKFKHDDNNRNIREVLEGFEEVVEEHGEKVIPMLVGFWEEER